MPNPPAAAILYHALEDLYQKLQRWLIWSGIEYCSPNVYMDKRNPSTTEPFVHICEGIHIKDSLAAIVAV